MFMEIYILKLLNIFNTVDTNYDKLVVGQMKCKKNVSFFKC